MTGRCAPIRVNTRAAIPFVNRRMIRFAPSRMPTDQSGSDSSAAWAGSATYNSESPSSASDITEPTIMIGSGNTSCGQLRRRGSRPVSPGASDWGRAWDV